MLSYSEMLVSFDGRHKSRWSLTRHLCIKSAAKVRHNTQYSRKYLEWALLHDLNQRKVGLLSDRLCRFSFRTHFIFMTKNIPFFMPFQFINNDFMSPISSCLMISCSNPIDVKPINNEKKKNKRKTYHL